MCKICADIHNSTFFLNEEVGSTYLNKEDMTKDIKIDNVL